MIEIKQIEDCHESEIEEACQGEYLKFADNLTKDEIIMAYRDTYLSDIENKTYLNVLINEMTLEDGVSCLNSGCLDPDDMEAFSQCCWSEDAVRLFKLEQM